MPKLTEPQTRQIERLLWTFGATMHDIGIQWRECAKAFPSAPQEPYLVLTATGVWKKGYYTGNRSAPWINYKGAVMEDVTHWAEVTLPGVADEL